MPLYAVLSISQRLLIQCSESMDVLLLIYQSFESTAQRNASTCGSRKLYLQEICLTNGEKQCCVLAPTLFSLYLTAMPEVAFNDFGDGIFIQTRIDADLFNWALFRAKPRTTKTLVREMMFAVVARSTGDIKSLMDRFTRPASQFFLRSTLIKLSAYTNQCKPRSSSWDKTLNYQSRGPVSNKDSSDTGWEMQVLLLENYRTGYGKAGMQD